MSTRPPRTKVPVELSSTTFAAMCESPTEPLSKPATRDQLRTEGIPASDDAPLAESTERTFFDFTARNAQFLEQVQDVRKSLEPDVIRAALEHGAPDPDAPRTSLDWDLGADLPGSIYTGYSRAFFPVHEWLAFRGLVCFPITGDGAYVRTTACSGRRLRGAFVWPLWEVPAGPDTVRSLVAHPDLPALSAEERRAMGISLVLRAGLTKKADGRSGTFAPPEPV